MFSTVAEVFLGLGAGPNMQKLLAGFDPRAKCDDKDLWPPAPLSSKELGIDFKHANSFTKEYGMAMTPEDILHDLRSRIIDAVQTGMIQKTADAVADRRLAYSGIDRTFLCQFASRYGNSAAILFFGATQILNN
jgi:hypothetical protein